MPFVIYDPHKEIFRQPFEAEDPDLFPEGISQPISPDFRVISETILPYKTGENSAGEGVYGYTSIKPYPDNVNLIPQAKYELFKDNPTFKALVEAGTVKVVFEKSVTDKNRFSLTDFAPFPLSDQEAKLKEQMKTVNEIVSQTNDQQQLNEWAQTIPQGKHGAVWAAVSTRLAVLLNPSTSRLNRRRRGG